MASSSFHPSKISLQMPNFIAVTFFNDDVRRKREGLAGGFSHRFHISVGDRALFAKILRMDVKNVAEVPPFVTKDGSEIRELLAYRNSLIRNQSLAEARLPVGASTQEHYHPKAEEIYLITAGTGRIRIDGETRDLCANDAVAIPPGTRHKLWNTGAETLRLLCCCSPAYEHHDTVITEL